MLHLAFIALRTALVARRPRPCPLVSPLRSIRAMAPAPAPAKSAKNPGPHHQPHHPPMLHKASLIQRQLQLVYPQAPKGFLHHTDPFTLLVAVVLSAQSLDAKVNQLTPHLFKVAPTPAKMAQLGAPRIQPLIRQIGLAPQKARNIASLSAAICERHGGRVPDTFEHLEALAGVGHKTASVVMMQAFNKPAFPVDTHIHRLACRWGCGDPKSVPNTERNLKLWFPDPSTWRELHTRIILFGREYCPARNHDMDACPICSFAATDEARAANDANPKKFVPPLKHDNPYSIRQVPSPSAVRSPSDPDFTPNGVPDHNSAVKSTPKRRKQQRKVQQHNGATTPRTRTRKAAEHTDQPDAQVQKRPARRRKTAEKPHQPNGDAAVEPGSTSRTRRRAETQTNVNSVQDALQMERPQAEETRGGRRTSSRLALKREQEGCA